MSPLPHLQRLRPVRLNRILSTVCPSTLQFMSTTAPKHANSSSKSSTAPSHTKNTSTSSILSKTARITRRPPPRSQPSQQSSAPDPDSPTPEAILAAEARESALRAARLRRASQRQEEALEEEKKQQGQKDYQVRYNTAARKWVSSIIALPIFLVTSYYLFDRLALGNKPKLLQKADESRNE